MGENDPAGVRIRLPVAIPALDKVVARRLARIGGVQHFPVGIGADRLASPPGREMPGGLLLPAFMLAAHLGDIDDAMPYVGRPERRARPSHSQHRRCPPQYELEPDRKRGGWGN